MANKRCIYKQTTNCRIQHWQGTLEGSLKIFSSLKTIVQSITSVKHLPILSRYSFFKPFDTRTQNFHLIFVITSKWCMACDLQFWRFERKYGSCVCSFIKTYVCHTYIIIILIIIKNKIPIVLHCRWTLVKHPHLILDFFY